MHIQLSQKTFQIVEGLSCFNPSAFWLYMLAALTCSLTLDRDLHQASDEIISHATGEYHGECCLSFNPNLRRTISLACHA